MSRQFDIVDFSMCVPVKVSRQFYIVDVNQCKVGRQFDIVDVFNMCACLGEQTVLYCSC